MCIALFPTVSTLFLPQWNMLSYSSGQTNIIKIVIGTNVHVATNKSFLFVRYIQHTTKQQYKQNANHDDDTYSLV